MSQKPKEKKIWMPWTQEEKQKFAELEPSVRQNYKLYMKYLPNRNYNQIKSYYHNSIYKLQMQQKAQKELAADAEGSYNNLINQLSASKLIVFKNIGSTVQFKHPDGQNGEVVDTKDQNDTYVVPSITQYVD